jgi:hypothetical protein
MKKIVTASRAKAGCKWVSCVGFVMGVSMFVSDAFIRDVTTLDAGIFMVFMSVLLMSSVAQWTGDPMDRLATVSLAGAWITMGGFLLSDWLGWPTGIQITAGILMAVFSAVFMVRAWQIDARG